MGVSNKLEKLYKIKIFLKDELGQDEKWLEQSAKNPEESWKNLNQNTNNKLIEKAGILVANNPSHYANFDALWKDFNTFSDKLISDEYIRGRLQDSYPNNYNTIVDKLMIFLKDEKLEQSPSQPITKEELKRINQNTNNKLIEKAGILVANNPSHYANFDALWKDFNTFAKKLLDEYLGEKESEKILDKLAEEISKNYFNNSSPYWKKEKELYKKDFLDCFKFQVYNNNQSLCPERIYSKYFFQKYFNYYFNIVGNYYNNKISKYKNNNSEELKKFQDFYNYLKKFEQDLQNNYNNDIFTFAKAHGIKVP